MRMKVHCKNRVKTDIRSPACNDGRIWPRGYKMCSFEHESLLFIQTKMLQNKILFLLSNSQMIYGPVQCFIRVHDNSSKDTSSNTTISLQRQLVYYDSLSNATLSLLLFLPTTSGRPNVVFDEVSFDELSWTRFILINVKY